jgi:phosphoenolpyruvate phosphomutase
MTGQEIATRSNSRNMRGLLKSPELTFLMEAHNGLSARIVESTGFAGIWASGLSISTAMGLRDNNELSWSQLLELLEHMVDQVSIPILVDADTGFGGFNNARRFARKAERLGISGICIEDKLYPKKNSFVGERQPLAEVAEFCGRIRACKDVQVDDEFCVVARIEALVSGYDLNEALDRAYAYEDAAADAILIHSKKKTADQILEFARKWQGNSPLVIVPTTYSNTPTDRFREAGISTLIWANQNIRAAMEAMQTICKKIFEQQTVHQVEREIATIPEIFRLLDYDELDAAEQRYLEPDPAASPRRVAS